MRGSPPSGARPNLGRAIPPGELTSPRMSQELDPDDKGGLEDEIISRPMAVSAAPAPIRQPRISRSTVSLYANVSPRTPMQRPAGPGPQSFHRAQSTQGLVRHDTLQRIVRGDDGYEEGDYEDALSYLDDILPPPPPPEDELASPGPPSDAPPPLRSANPPPPSDLPPPSGMRRELPATPAPPRDLPPPIEKFSGPPTDSPPSLRSPPPPSDVPPPVISFRPGEVPPPPPPDERFPLYSIC